MMRATPARHSSAPATSKRSGTWPSSSHPQARERTTYERLSDDEFTETFELASPGRPLEVYGKTRLRRIP